MITIKCAQCKRKILKYHKIGQGRVLRCYKDRIVRVYEVQDKASLKCACGNVIGVDKGAWFAMKQHAFETSGRVAKK